MSDMVSQVLGLIRVFYDPKRVMAEAREHPSPWLPLVAASVISGAALWVGFPFVQEFISEKLAQVATETGAGSPPLTPSHVLLLAVIKAIVGVPARALVQALLYQSLLPLVGGEVSFLQALAVTSYANLISASSGIAKLPLVMVTRTPLVHFDLAVFLGQRWSGTFLYNLCSLVDFFTLWSLAVVTYGLSRVAGISGRKAAFVTFGLWVSYVVLISLVRAGTPGG